MSNLEAHPFAEMLARMERTQNIFRAGNFGSGMGLSLEQIQADTMARYGIITPEVELIQIDVEGVTDE